jgi:hypothetical protein
MKALVLYVLFVIAGTVLAGFVGMYLERQFSPMLSLVVFLTMFFANFAICWILTILAMDGSLKNAQGAKEQRDIESSGRAQLTRSAEA